MFYENTFFVQFLFRLKYARYFTLSIFDQKRTAKGLAEFSHRFSFFFPFTISKYYLPTSRRISSVVLPCGPTTMLRFSVGATTRLCGRSLSGSQCENPVASLVRGAKNNSSLASRRAPTHIRGAAAAVRSAKPLADLSAPSRSVLKSLERNCAAAAAAPAAKGVPFSELSVGVPKETFDNEKRVALSPAAAATLIKNGFSVNVEAGAGFEAKFLDADYVAAGCKIVDVGTAFTSDIVLKVRPPAMEEVPLIKDGGHLISFIYPAQNKELLDALAEKKATVLGMECVPRISRAQV